MTTITATSQFQTRYVVEWAAARRNNVIVLLARAPRGTTSLNDPQPPACLTACWPGRRALLADLEASCTPAAPSRTASLRRLRDALIWRMADGRQSSFGSSVYSSGPLMVHV
jgi:hypothetical protein